MLNRRQFIATGLAAAALPFQTTAGFAADWTQIESAAKGQTVYFNAWAGADNINAYIQWAADVAHERFGFDVQHVKITDTAEVVKRVRDEVASGKTDGSVDLVWINGENFKAMKQEKLLFGPFAESLPNFALVDVAGKPTTRQDFSEAVEGLEAPWGMAQLTFFADGEKVVAPPLSIRELIAFAKQNPGRVTYPAPPEFHGTTFLKQVLYESADDRSAFAQPADAQSFRPFEGPWAALLDELHKACWRNGKQFPKAQADVTNMVADGELLVGLTFNPNEPANLVTSKRMPQTTIAWQNRAGTIGNTHFVAIPANGKAKAAAQVFANFLLSPEAQARKNDLAIWGDPTVLDVNKLADADKAMFSAQATGGGVRMPGPALLEPHSSWVSLLEEAWLKRYGQG